MARWTLWAFATRRAECIEQARIILVNAVERLPNFAIFHYNLACYECQLGDLLGAKARLERAISRDAQFRKLALDDEDLKPLWERI